MPTYDAGQSGLVGTIGVTILDEDGAEHVARTTAGITEPVAGSGVYHVADHDPDATLTYVWDNGVGTVGASETLYAGRETLPDLATAAAVTALNDLSAADVAAELETYDAAKAADIPDDYATAAALATLDGVADAIKLKTDKIGVAHITVTSPVATDGTINLYEADDYAAADTRALTFTVPVGSVPDLAGATVQLQCAQATWTATSCTSDDADWTIVFELTSTETAALSPGTQSYEIEARLATSGRIVTLGTGTLTVVRDIPEAT